MQELPKFLLEFCHPVVEDFSFFMSLLMLGPAGLRQERPSSWGLD